MSESPPGPASVEGGLERWAIRQALAAGRRPWAVTFVIALALLAWGALFIAARTGLPDGDDHWLTTVVFTVWFGAVGGGACLASSLVHRHASLTRVGTAWAGCVLLLPAVAFAPVYLAPSWSVPLDTLEGVLGHLSFAAITLAPALATVFVRGCTRRPVGVRAVPVLLAVPFVASLVLENTGGLPRMSHQMLEIATWPTLAVLPLCWWMRAPSRSLRHLVLPTVAAQIAFAAVLSGDMEAPVRWTLLAGVPVMLLGALPFALVARAADSLSVVPADHPLHDWGTS